MLFYLNNWEGVAPGAPPPFPLSARRRGRQGVRTAPQGINENYARELLELHTLGVDGGYDQHDVIEVARIFTGWSIRRPQQGGDFEFHDWAHDTGDKQVLGLEFERGQGMDEGIRLLKLLANHPATTHHLSRQLCQRFVNDDPPDGCVDAAVALAAGRLPGAAVALDSVAPDTVDVQHLIAAIDDGILGGTMSQNTKRVISEQLSDVKDPVQARALAIGLAIGGPEFQRQ